MNHSAAKWAMLAALLAMAGCSSPLNSPYPADEAGRNMLHAAYTEPPAHLDPTRAYNANEYTFIGQIYEPPLQYHYLKRPYELAPLTAETVPIPRYYDAGGKALANDAPAERIARSVYEIRLRPGIRTVARRTCRSRPRSGRGSTAWPIFPSKAAVNSTPATTPTRSNASPTHACIPPSMA